jgi:phospholipid/cholesterol/gamma-HCH transport system ATP-binding protein
VIVIENLSKSFEAVKALIRVQAVLPERKTTVVLGGSGHGKTVLLRIMCGLLRPDTGRVLFDGQDVGAFSERELYRFWEGVGFLFQDNALIDSLTVEDNVGLFLRYRSKQSEAEIRRRVRSLLEFVGLEECGRSLPEEISWGMKKRVALARALAKRPDYFLFDEPTSGLDDQNWTLITRLLADSLKANTATAVIATHDLRLTRELADEVVFLHRGRVTFAGPKASISERALVELYRGAVDGG